MDYRDFEYNSFTNVTDLNIKALEWCTKQNFSCHKSIDMTPQTEHDKECSKVLVTLEKSQETLLYLCPPRRISFDGFVTYEGRRFGIPYSYTGKTVRVSRNAHILTIYSSDMTRQLVMHDVTWSRRDSYCKDQYVFPEQPEEFPTATVKTVIEQTEPELPSNAFDRFDFSKEDSDD